MAAPPKGRVERGLPSKAYYRTTVREAISDLVRDFENRCAYSMQHADWLGGLGGLHVEHFNPNLKSAEIQDYFNLFPVSHTCNTVKGKKWPTKEELADGLRFLNCCEEVDYGEQIFEDPISHELVGTTPAAKFHLRHCGLKGGRTGAYFRDQREKRSQLWKTLEGYGVTPTNVETIHVADPAVQSLIALVKGMIPPIKAPIEG
jgi:hypothetical protein